MGSTNSREASNSSLENSSQDLSSNKTILKGIGNNSGFLFDFMVVPCVFYLFIILEKTKQFDDQQLF